MYVLITVVKMKKLVVMEIVALKAMSVAIGI